MYDIFTFKPKLYELKFCSTLFKYGLNRPTTKQIRNLRGTRVLFKTDGETIKKYWMPNG